jgi:hypothetical protein
MSFLSRSHPGNQRSARGPMSCSKILLFLLLLPSEISATHFHCNFIAGPTEYTTCDSLLTKSSSQYSKTSLFEIVQSGIPQNKIVLGKPATKEDAQQGNMDAGVIAQCLKTAKGKGWSGGVMGWKVSELARNDLESILLTFFGN